METQTKTTEINSHRNDQSQTDTRLNSQYQVSSNSISDQIERLRRGDYIVVEDDGEYE